MEKIKYLLIGFLLLFRMLNAGPEENQLQEVESEIRTLESQKRQLKQEISDEYLREMQFEMQTQRDFIEHEWHDLGKKLKKAEESESKAHNKEALLRKIDLELIQLSKQRKRLLELMERKGSD